MKRNQFVLVAMALIVAFGMTACPTDVDDTELAGSITLNATNFYVGEEITASYDGKEKPVVWTWTVPEGANAGAALEKYTPNVIGKYRVTANVAGKDAKWVDIVVAPAVFKNTTWKWSGDLAGDPATKYQNVTETIEMKSNYFKLDSTVATSSSVQHEYLWFTIENWEPMPTGITPPTGFTTGYKVSGISVNEGYPEGTASAPTMLTAFYIYLPSGDGSFVRTGQIATNGTANTKKNRAGNSDRSYLKQLQ
jgi:hypothetical protein